jgi:hypothetical protein
LESVVQCSKEKQNTKHIVAIFEDHATQELIDFIKRCITLYSSSNVEITLFHLLDKTGIMESIKSCYEWMRDNGNGLVYQVQDDYMFTLNAITEMVDIYEQMLLETGTHSIISSWNHSWIWSNLYKNMSTPRAVIVGKKGYWIQYYDMSCSFLTSHEQFIKHWDLYIMFFYLIDRVNQNNGDLENKSLNYMLTKRGILGLVPINSVAFHLQSEHEMDAHIDYKPLWDSINVT